MTWKAVHRTVPQSYLMTEISVSRYRQQQQQQQAYVLRRLNKIRAPRRLGPKAMFESESLLYPNIHYYWGLKLRRSVSEGSMICLVGASAASWYCGVRG
jgi:hypothetical protein